jgi:hypothetical protein
MEWKMKHLLPLRKNLVPFDKQHHDLGLKETHCNAPFIEHFILVTIHIHRFLNILTLATLHTTLPSTILKKNPSIMYL